MKQTILSIALIALSSLGFINNAHAQKSFYIGVQGGPQLSSMLNQDDMDNDNIDYKTTGGASFGVSGGYMFNKHMGVGAEVNYSIEGQRLESSKLEYTQRLSYVKIPVLFNYNTNPEKKFMFTAKAGPQIGILTDAKMKDKDHNDIGGDVKDQYENVTFGGVIGAGARMNVARNLYVDAGLRVDGAFTNSENKDYKGYTSGRADTYNLNAGVEIGVKYFIN